MPLRIPWRPFSPHLIYLRALSTTAPAHRDLGAKYRYRPPPETYLTSSTTPVSSSIQAVPPPSQDNEVLVKTEGAPVGGRKATVLPVMQPLHHEAVPEKRKERGTEMTVAEVVIPPKPSPPESDGMFALCFYSKSPWLIVRHRVLHVRLRRTSLCFPLTDPLADSTCICRTAYTLSTPTTSSHITNLLRPPSPPSWTLTSLATNGRKKSGSSVRRGRRGTMRRRSAHRGRAGMRWWRG